MCHTSWGGDVFLDRRMQFGDKSAVEGLFQFTANLILVSAQDAIDGDPATRALVPHAAHLRQYIDAKPTHAAYRLWERERVAVFGEDVTQLRANHTDGYVGDFMGSALGRRRAFATAAVHRAFIGKRGANFPLKALKVCLPAPSLGGLIDLDSKTATLSAERAEKYSAQTREVLNSPRYDDTEFHRYTSRLVSAARYEPAGRAWLVSSYCALKQARRRSEKRGGRTRVFIGPGAKKEAQFWLHCLAQSSGIALFVRIDTGTSAGAGMLPSSMSVSAHGGEPVCVDPPALAGVSCSCQEEPAAALAPATASSMATPSSVAAAESAAGTGALTIAAYVRTGAAGGSDGGSVFGLSAC